MSSGPEISRNEPSITSNRPLYVKIWLEQCDMVRYLSMRFTHHCELRTSWGGQDWVLELWRSWSMIPGIDWYAPSRCNVLHRLSGHARRAGGISRNFAHEPSTVSHRYGAQDSSELSRECFDVSCGTEILWNEPSITSNRPFDLKLWHSQGHMSGYMSMSFRHQVESGTSWGGQGRVLELWCS